MEKSSRSVTMMNNYNSFHPDPVLAGRTATAKQTFKKEMSAKLHCDIFTNTLCWAFPLSLVYKNSTNTLANLHRM